MSRYLLERGKIRAEGRQARVCVVQLEARNDVASAGRSGRQRQPSSGQGNTNQQFGDHATSAVRTTKTILNTACCCKETGDPLHVYQVHPIEIIWVCHSTTRRWHTLPFPSLPKYLWKNYILYTIHISDSVGFTHFKRQVRPRPSCHSKDFNLFGVNTSIFGATTVHRNNLNAR